MENSTFETILKRDRIITATGLIVLSGLSWLYTIYDAWRMESFGSCSRMIMPVMQSWVFQDVFMIFWMWVVMMIAMMIPSASPMILLFAAVNRKRRNDQRPFVPTGVFVLGYLFAWTGFSAFATLAQWVLHSAALLSPVMVATSPLLGGAILIAAGIFQWTPWKHTCLRHCRSPLDFLMTEWREGKRAAFIMGLKHGIFCLGCCWVLMCLLFVTGVMNLTWIGILTIFVLIEKVIPNGLWVGRMAGLVLVGWGMWMLQSAIFQN